MRFAFIEAEKASFPVRAVVPGAGRVAGRASTRGRRARRRRHAQADERLGVEIAAIHAESRQRYGSPRVHAELRRPRPPGESQARGAADARTAASPAGAGGGSARRPTRATRFPSRPTSWSGSSTQAAPDRAWVTDITYIPTGEGWLYLAVILDLCSRVVVGWAMSERITRELALDALDMALVRRRPRHGLLHHSDRGSQYASGDYQAVLAAEGIVVQHEPAGQLLGQRRGRELLRHAEDRAGPRRDVGHARGRARRRSSSTSRSSTTGSGAIRRSGISARGPSSGSAHSNGRQLNPGVHQTGAGPCPSQHARAA